MSRLLILVVACFSVFCITHSSLCLCFRWFEKCLGAGSAPGNFSNDIIHVMQPCFHFTERSPECSAQRKFMNELYLLCSIRERSGKMNAGLMSHRRDLLARVFWQAPIFSNAYNVIESVMWSALKISVDWKSHMTCMSKGLCDG